MGMDLTLLPLRTSDRFCHELLEVGRYYEHFAKIDELPSEPCPPIDGFVCREHPDWEDNCYGKVTRTPYGDPLQCVLARDLKTVELPGPVGAFVAALDDDVKIGLYWH
jgi:hypothetical protein